VLGDFPELPAKNPETQIVRKEGNEIIPNLVSITVIRAFISLISYLLRVRREVLDSIFATTYNLPLFGRDQLLLTQQ